MRNWKTPVFFLLCTLLFSDLVVLFIWLPHPSACLLTLFISWLIWWGLHAKSSCSSFFFCFLFVEQALHERKVTCSWSTSNKQKKEMKHNSWILPATRKFQQVPLYSSETTCSVLATIPCCKAGLHWMLLCTLEEALTVFKVHLWIFLGLLWTL